MASFDFTLYDDGSFESTPADRPGSKAGRWYDASVGTRISWYTQDGEPDLMFTMLGTAELPSGDLDQELSTTGGWGSATATGIKALEAAGIEVERNADWGWVSRVATAAAATKDGPAEQTVWILDSLERTEVEPIGAVLDDVLADPDFKPSVANAGFEQVGADRIADEFSAQGYRVVAPDGYTPTTGWRRTASAWMVDQTNHGVSAQCSAGPEVVKEWVESWQ